MNVLAIDTATSDLVVGVVDLDSGVTHDATVAETRHHNEQLVPAVQQALADAGCTFGDLSAVVVGVGPGPFTGLRVGMAAAVGFGDALGIPVHGVCTLDAIAEAYYQNSYPDTGAARNLSAEADESSPAATIVVATDARRRETYWAAYELDDRPGRRFDRVHPPSVQTPASLPAPARPLVALVAAPSVAANIALDGAASPVAPVWCPPTPAALVACAVAEVGSVDRLGDLDAAPAALAPLYLRRPDAKEPAVTPLSPALVRKDGGGAP